MLDFIDPRPPCDLATALAASILKRLKGGALDAEAARDVHALLDVERKMKHRDRHVRHVLRSFALSPCRRGSTSDLRNALSRMMDLAEAERRGCEPPEIDPAKTFPSNVVKKQPEFGKMCGAVAGLLATLRTFEERGLPAEMRDKLTREIDATVALTDSFLFGGRAPLRKLKETWTFRALRSAQRWLQLAQTAAGAAVCRGERSGPQEPRGPTEAKGRPAPKAKPSTYEDELSKRQKAAQLLKEIAADPQRRLMSVPRFAAERIRRDLPEAGHVLPALKSFHLRFPVMNPKTLTWGETEEQLRAAWVEAEKAPTGFGAITRNQVELHIRRSYPPSPHHFDWLATDIKDYLETLVPGLDDPREYGDVARAVRMSFLVAKGLDPRRAPEVPQDTALTVRRAMDLLQPLQKWCAEQVKACAPAKPDASQAATPQAVGHLKIEQIRDLYPELDKAALESLRKRLEHWRRRHEDEAFKGEDDRGTGRCRWAYPAAVVSQFVKKMYAKRGG